VSGVRETRLLRSMWRGQETEPRPTGLRRWRRKLRHKPPAAYGPPRLSPTRLPTCSRCRARCAMRCVTSSTTPPTTACATWTASTRSPRPITSTAGSPRDDSVPNRLRVQPAKPASSPELVPGCSPLAGDATVSCRAPETRRPTRARAASAEAGPWVRDGSIYPIPPRPLRRLVNEAEFRPGAPTSRRRASCAGAPAPRR
jgi:hypothetical protein